MFQKNVPLSLYSNYRIGGKAKYFYQAQGLSDLMEAVRNARRMRAPIFILGGGTNLLINDRGFAGLFLKPEISFFYHNDNYLRVGAGVLISDLIDFVADKGLSGLEWAGGLPGTLGGAIRGNAGAFGGEIKDSVVEVISLDIAPKEPVLISRTADECAFNYRTSVFKQGGQEIILEAVLSLQPGDPAAIGRAINEKIIYRQERHPMEYPNIGSIFKNVPWQSVPAEHQERFQEKVKHDPFPVLPTAVLINACDLKGVSFGGAMISSRHPNFIVNVLGASNQDVKNLIELMKDAVKEKFNILLEEEVQCV